MMFDTTDKPGVDEQYQVAGNASNLTVEADRRGAGDVLIAAGWSESRVGMALLRLHSEWDRAAKPRRPDRDSIAKLAAIIRAEDAKAKERPKEPPEVRAQRAADSWYANELRLLANSLKSRSAVWAQLLPWATLKGIDPDVVAAALLYWLDPICGSCRGLQFLKAANSPALSAKLCPKCRGSGRAQVPAGSAKVLWHLDYCVGVARGSLRKRLRTKE
jgi:hypothetical protein